MESLTIAIYDGDGAWAEPTGDDRIHGDEMLNGAVLTLLGYTFGHIPDWIRKEPVTWRISDPVRREVTFKGPLAEITALRNDAESVCHHDIVRF